MDRLFKGWEKDSIYDLSREKADSMVLSALRYRNEPWSFL